jgi:hypothetical protein
MKVDGPRGEFVTNGKEANAQNIPVLKIERKKPLRELRCGWEYILRLIHIYRRPEYVLN